MVIVYDMYIQKDDKEDFFKTACKINSYIENVVYNKEVIIVVRENKYVYSITFLLPLVKDSFNIFRILLMECLRVLFSIYPAK